MIRFHIHNNTHRIYSDNHNNTLMEQCLIHRSYYNHRGMMCRFHCCHKYHHHNDLYWILQTLLILKILQTLRILRMQASYTEKLETTQYAFVLTLFNLIIFIRKMTLYPVRIILCEVLNLTKILLKVTLVLRR